MPDSIYKEWYEVNSEEEVREKLHELLKKGYENRDIYVFRFNGRDGRYHREVFVFAENIYQSEDED